jgi:flagellar hook-length control protein FliK
MDFAANAVSEMAAPARPAPNRAPANAQDDARFEDHLDAAALDAAPPDQSAARAAPSLAKETSPPEDAVAPDLAENSASAPTQPPAAASLWWGSPQVEPPMVLQVIAAATPASAPSTAPTMAQASDTAAPEAATEARGELNRTAAPATMSARADAAAPPHTGLQPHGKPVPSATASAAADDVAGRTQTTPPPLPAAATIAAAAQQPAASPANPATPTSAPAETTPAALMAAANAEHEPRGRIAKALAAQDVAKTDGATEPPRTTPAAPPANASTRGAPAPMQAPAREAIAAVSESIEPAPVQQSGSASSHAPSHTQHGAADQGAARALPAAQQVAREIVRRFDGGATRFELRLDPPELGRVEVRLDVSRDQRVTAMFAADSPQALTELARHARELEQMLQSAGLELSENGLSFDLRQGGERAGVGDFGGADSEAAAHAEQEAPTMARPLGYERWRGVRVDLMV